MHPTWPAALLLLGACASSAAPPPERPGGDPSPRSSQAEPASASGAIGDVRRIAAGARFIDLVALARTLSEAGQRDSERGCLVGRHGAGFSLAADLLSAIDPIPEPPVTLETWTSDHEARVTVLGPWGRSGAEQGALVLSPFTTTPPASARRPVVAVVLEHGRAFLRYGDRDAAEADDGLALAAVVPRLLSTADPQAAVVVTAEADVPVETVFRLLQELPHGRAVALAVALPRGTKLPEPSEARGSSGCPEGLPEPATDAAEGELETAVVLETIAPLRDGAARCMRSAVASGKVVLALRVAESGAVEHACLIEDATGSPLFGSCLTEMAAMLRFPRPEPSGFVDVHLPLDLRAPDLREQAPACP